MSSLVDIFLGAFVLAFSGAMMPGPLFAYVVDESMRRGVWTGPLTILGHALLETVMVALLAFGVGRLLNQPGVLAGIAFVGGGMLLWMGVGMVRRAPRMTLAATAGRVGHMHPVVAGVVVSLANPYWTLWWVSIGAGLLVVAAKCGLAGIAVFFAGHILADLLWYSLISGAVAGGRRLMPARVYRAILIFCGLMLLAFAMWFFWNGLGFLCKMT